MHHFVTEIYAHVHISATKWCPAGLVHCGTCATGVFLWLLPANIAAPGRYLNVVNS